MIDIPTSQNTDCQLRRLPNMHEPIEILERAWQLRGRIKRFVKRRLIFLTNLVLGRGEDSVPVAAPAAGVAHEAFHPGDAVWVRSREEIQATLGNWNNLKGCSFMEEMWQFCGTRQRVFKHVSRFLDERDYHTKKVQGVYLLENAICQGTVDFGPCDRSCFFFWREEWLKKLEKKEPL